MNTPVVFIEPLGTSGIFHVASELARRSADAGYHITLLSDRNHEPSDARNIRITGVLNGMNKRHSKIRRAVSYTASWRGALKIIDEIKPLLVNLHDTFMPGVDWAAMQMIRKRRIPILYTLHDVNKTALHGAQDAGFASRIPFFNRKLLNLANRVVVFSKVSEDFLLQHSCIGSEKLDRIVHGSFDFYPGRALPSKAESRAALGLPASNPVCLFFGTIKRSKGVADLIHAIIGLNANRETPVHLAVAGRQRDDDPTDYLALAAPLDSAIHFFPGHIPPDDIPMYFAACDLVVLPYRFIYQSGVLAHCLAYGTPIAPTNIAGFREYLGEDYPGVWADPGDVDSLTEAIRKMLDTPELSASVVRHLTQLAQNAYSWKTIGEDYVRIMKQTIEDP